MLLFANTDWYLYNFRRSLAKALQDDGHEVLLVSPGGPYGERLEALGFRWVRAPLQRRSLNPLRELAFIWWLRRLIVGNEVELVHGFTIKCAVYASMAGRLAGVKARINAVAGMGYVFTSDDLKARLLRPIVRLLLRFALAGRGTRLILQNPDDVELFKSARLLQPQRIRLIPGSGVDCRRFTPALVPRQDQPLRVLLPARLLWDKGLAEYVEASRRLRTEGRNIEFLLAGTPDAGNPAAVPEEMVRDWVADGVLTWLGHVEDMPALMQTVDVVVLPSYREGLPKGLIEAAACGLALVASDVPGCREVIRHECDGLLVPARDATALTAAIRRLEEDSCLRAGLGAAAREKALQCFDERLIIESTLDVYREFAITP